MCECFPVLHRTSAEYLNVVHYQVSQSYLILTAKLISKTNKKNPLHYISGPSLAVYLGAVSRWSYAVFTNLSCAHKSPEDLVKICRFGFSRSQLGPKVLHFQQPPMLLIHGHYFEQQGGFRGLVVKEWERERYQIVIRNYFYVTFLVKELERDSDF